MLKLETTQWDAAITWWDGAITWWDAAITWWDGAITWWDAAITWRDGTIFTDCLGLSSRTVASGTPAQEREVQKLSEFGVQDPASMSGTFGCEGSLVWPQPIPREGRGLVISFTAVYLCCTKQCRTNHSAVFCYMHADIRKLHFVILQKVNY